MKRHEIIIHEKGTQNIICRINEILRGCVKQTGFEIILLMIWNTYTPHTDTNNDQNDIILGVVGILPGHTKLNHLS